MLITDFLENNAKNSPDETSLIEINPEHRKSEEFIEFSLVESASEEVYRREMTWEDFDRRANRFGNLLLANGVKKGDKVAILLMNCLEWLPIYFGALKAGAVVVPLNYRYTAQEIKYCLELSDASILIFGKEFIGRVEEILDEVPGVRHMFFVGGNCPDFSRSYFENISYCTSRKPQVELTEEDDACIYFSSGTTGFPKAILHNHQSLVHACDTEQNHHLQTKDDCFICMPPLYHTGAKMHWFGSLKAGSRAVLLRGISPKWILETVSQEGCSVAFMLVPWAQDLMDAVDRGELRLSDYDLSRWRLTHIGAQPVPASLIERWCKMFPNQKYDTNYGLSESIGPGCVHLGLENTRKAGAIGIPGFGWSVKIVDDTGNEVGVDVVGELCVKGPGVMTCYYKNEEATRESLRDGWLYTGDVARRDVEGFIYLVDRKKDVIISGGENIYPVQIEDFLRTHEAIKDVAVIGRPHERLGEIAAAIIEIKEGFECTAEEIDEFCLALPRYKRPREIFFEPVPRNPTGKIEKPKLREKYGSLGIVAKQTIG